MQDKPHGIGIGQACAAAVHLVIGEWQEERRVLTTKTCFWRLLLSCVVSTIPLQSCLEAPAQGLTGISPSSRQRGDCIKLVRICLVHPTILKPRLAVGRTSPALSQRNGFSFDAVLSFDSLGGRRSPALPGPCPGPCPHPPPCATPPSSPRSLDTHARPLPADLGALPTPKPSQGDETLLSLG